jgi:tetratricopeptide (TPR) repeat protein
MAGCSKSASKLCAFQRVGICKGETVKGFWSLFLSIFLASLQNGLGQAIPPGGSMKWNKRLVCFVCFLFLSGVTLGQTGTKLTLKEITQSPLAAPLFEQGRSLYRAGQFESALQKFEAARAAGEKASQLDLYLGMTYAQLKQWDKTLAILGPLESQHASEGEYWFLLGTAQSSTGRLQQARASFYRSLKLDPRNSSTYQILGMVELQLNNPNAAYRSWLRAVDLNPQDAISAYSIGRLFYDAQHTANARQWFQQTLSIDPRDFRARLYLGLAFEAEGKSDLAGAAYQQALTDSRLQGKPYAWIYSTLGKFLRNAGDLEQAKTILEEGYQAAPDAAVCSELGQLLIQLKERERAETVLREAIRRDPALSAPYYHLGLLLRSMGKLAEAQQAMATFQTAKAKEKKEKIRLSVQAASDAGKEKTPASEPENK